MKHHLIFLGLFAGAAMPQAAKADPPVVIEAERPPTWLVHTETVGQGEN